MSSIGKSSSFEINRVYVVVLCAADAGLVSGASLWRRERDSNCSPLFILRKLLILGNAKSFKYLRNARRTHARHTRRGSSAGNLCSSSNRDYPFRRISPPFASLVPLPHSPIHRTIPPKWLLQASHHAQSAAETANERRKNPCRSKGLIS